jgi:hypothetical protein
MARNEEKAQSMLNRFLAAKQDDKRGPKARRPYLASECTDLNEADRWRQQILREIGRKVMEIQNAGLGEHRWGGLQGTVTAAALSSSSSNSSSSMMCQGPWLMIAGYVLLQDP